MSQKPPIPPVSCEYDQLAYVPKAFGGTQEEDAPAKTPKKPKKPRRPYAELRAASAFSFLDSASLPEDLVFQAAEQDLPSVALVDTNGVYGAPRFYTAAKKAGIKALVGADPSQKIYEDCRNVATALFQVRQADDTDAHRTGTAWLRSSHLLLRFMQCM